MLTLRCNLLPPPDRHPEFQPNQSNANPTPVTPTPADPRTTHPLLTQVVQDEPRALALVREGIEKFPAEQSLYQTLGTLLDRKGDYEGAVAAFRESIRIHPNGAAFVAWALMEERHKSTKVREKQHL